MLEKQIIQLNDRTKGVTIAIHTLYARLHSGLGNKKLDEQIAFLQREKIDLNDRRAKLKDKLQPEGLPSKG